MGFVRNFTQNKLLYLREHKNLLNTMANEIIYTYGTLMKEEQVKSLSNVGIKGTMVMETPEPFPGFLTYYSETPHAAQPLFVYLGLEEENFYEDVAYATKNVKQKADIKFSAAYGSIAMNYKIHKCIRLRYLEGFDQVLPIQELFKEEGLTFRKAINLNKPATGLIRLKKMFKLDTIGEGMYQDMEQSKMAYIKLPKKMVWSDFLDLVKHVRNNWNKELVDFGFTTLYMYECVEDAVRVYSPAQRPELIKEIKEQFLKYI